jgi:hypothetical protein
MQTGVDLYPTPNGGMPYPTISGFYGPEREARYGVILSMNAICKPTYPTLRDAGSTV